MKNFFKFSFIIFFISPIFFLNFSYSEFGDDFELGCTTCESVKEVEIPVQEIENIVTLPTENIPEVEGFPAVQSQIDCGNNHYSSWSGKCMKWCDNVTGEYQINEVCPISGQIQGTQVGSSLNQNYITPTTNQTYSGVNITYRYADYANVPVTNNTQTQTQYIPQAPTIWGGSNGYSQTSAPVIYNTNQNTVTNNTQTQTQYIPQAPTIWGGSNGYSQTSAPVIYNTNQNTVTNNTQTQTQYIPQAPTIWGGSNGYSQTSAHQIYNANTAATQLTSPRIVCPVNYNVDGQKCIPIKKTCRDGMQVNFYVSCTKVCWGGQASGQNIPENENCPNVNSVTNSTAQTYVISNLYKTNKVCKNGLTVKSDEICNKRCPDGTNINEMYECPVQNYADNVITTSVNNLSSNSARCNALANINSNINTSAYFEYGTNQNLGNLTNFANIGNRSVSFSNTIENLKPSTTYYCRAVIKNNNNIFKGDILSFTTYAETENRRYVSEIRQESIKKNSTNINSKLIKKETLKTVVICKDSEGNIKDLEDGEKLMLLEIENKSGYLSSGEVSEYNIKYKNNSNLILKNISLDIKIPEGLVALKGDDYEIKNGQIVIDRFKLKAGEENELIIRVQARKDLPTGKSFVISVTSTYDILDENDQVISDEISAYVISSISEREIDSENSFNDGQNIFWSGWLFRMLLSMIFFIILAILGRNIYKKIINRRYSNQVLGHH